jgi:hypothetical protein
MDSRAFPPVVMGKCATGHIRKRERGTPPSAPSHTLRCRLARCSCQLAR